MNWSLLLSIIALAISALALYSARLSYGRIDVAVGPIHVPILEALDHLILPLALTNTGARARAVTGVSLEFIRDNGSTTEVRAIAAADVDSLRQDPSNLGLWASAIVPSVVAPFSSSDGSYVFDLKTLRKDRYLLDDINAIWEGTLPFRVIVTAVPSLPRQRRRYRSSIWRGMGEQGWEAPPGVTVIDVTEMP